MRVDPFVVALRAYSLAVPFQRFTVELVNGERLIGYHPECFRMEDDLVWYVEPDGTAQAFDASSVARLVSVVIPPGAH
jgi:hypothetical protein